MQKYLTIILALWLTVGSSCAVKAEIMNLFPNSIDTEQSRHAEKTGSLNLSKQSEATCAQTMISSKQELFAPASILNIPDLLISLLFLLSVVCLGFRLKENQKIQAPPFSHLALYKTPLYLRFNRLQLYA